MYWIALLPGSEAQACAPSPVQQQAALGWWALQFTPRVALHDEATRVGANMPLA